MNKMILYYVIIKIDLLKILSKNQLMNRILTNLNRNFIRVIKNPTDFINFYFL